MNKTEKIIVKVINKSGTQLPVYATELSAGMDLRASINEPIEIDSLQRVLVPTGLYISLPKGDKAKKRISCKTWYNCA